MAERGERAATSTLPLRVAIVDDHTLFREGVRRILEAEPDIELVGQAGTVSGALEMLAGLSADVLLLDLRLGGANGLDLLAHLQASGPPRVLIVTAFPDDRVIADAVRAGARGVVLKDAGPEALLAAVRRVASDEMWIAPELATRVVGALARDDSPGALGQLTAREREIVSLVGRGLRNRDIADRLGVAEKTVKGHLTNVFYKLGVTDRLELALLAIKTRLAPAPGED